jgi:hypothetical protein
MWRPHQATEAVIGPTVQGAHNVFIQRAGSIKHNGLAVAANVGHQIKLATPINEHGPMVFHFQGAISAVMRHHELVTYVPGRAVKKNLFLERKEICV